MLVEVVSSPLFLTCCCCCSGCTSCSTRHHTAAWLLSQTAAAETVPAQWLLVQASAGCFSPWRMQVLFSFLILSSARTQQRLVGTDLVLCSSSPPRAPMERSPFSLLGIAKDAHSHLTMGFVGILYRSGRNDHDV